MPTLAFRGCNQREHPVAKGDQDVHPLTLCEVQGTGLDRPDGEAVGVGDGHHVAAERDPEEGVGGGVDDPDPRPLARPGGEGARRSRDASVDQVVVGPVVQDRHPFMVVSTRLGRVVNDQLRVQAAIDLDATVRVEEVGARVRSEELVDEAGGRCDGFLGEAGDAVGAVVQTDAVPVDARLDRKGVFHMNPQHFTGLGAKLLPGNPAAIGPGGRGDPAEIHLVGSQSSLPGRQAVPHGAL